MITIIGLGYGGEGGLTLAALTALKNCPNIILRTEKCSSADFLAEIGVKFRSLDDIYEDSDSFDDMIKKSVKRILDSAADGDTAFAVPGNVASDSTADALIKAAESENIPHSIIPGLSYADSALAAANITAGDYRAIPAADMSRIYIDVRTTNIFFEIESRLTASDLKCFLLEHYDAAHRVFLCRGQQGDIIISDEIELYELDHRDCFDHLAGVIIPPVNEITQARHYDFYHLVELMERLRGDNGCAWDRAQTHASIEQSLIEEAYEAAEAIREDNMDSLCDELGDVLLQVVFHSQIAHEHGEFDYKNVLSAICTKLISRHTHVFGDASADTPEEVKANWEAIKREKRKATVTDSMQGLPKGMPALVSAYKVQAKAATVGFDWPDAKGALDKLREEAEELAEAYASGKGDNIADELGDVLFAAVNVSRLCGLAPESVLFGASEKFISRFSHIENRVKESGKPWESFSLEELDKWWDEAKLIEKQPEN